jgi:hypothetical protein
MKTLGETIVILPFLQKRDERAESDRAGIGLTLLTTAKERAMCQITIQHMKNSVVSHFRRKRIHRVCQATETGHRLTWQARAR